MLRTVPDAGSGAPLVEARRRVVITAKQAQLRVDGVIHPDAVGVQRGRIGIAGVELRQARPRAPRRSAIGKAFR